MSFNLKSGFESRERESQFNTAGGSEWQVSVTAKLPRYYRRNEGGGGGSRFAKLAQELDKSRHYRGMNFSVLTASCE